MSIDPGRDIRDIVEQLERIEKKLDRIVRRFADDDARSFKPLREKAPPRPDPSEPFLKG